MLQIFCSIRPVVWIIVKQQLFKIFLLSLRVVSKPLLALIFAAGTSFSFLNISNTLENNFLVNVLLTYYLSLQGTWRASGSSSNEIDESTFLLLHKVTKKKKRITLFSSHLHYIYKIPFDFTRHYFTKLFEGRASIKKGCNK